MPAELTEEARERLDAHWEPSVERGFLPREDPLEQLPESYRHIDALASDVRVLLERGTVRQELSALKPIEIDPALSGRERDRLMMLYSFFASAYVHEPGQPRAASIPAGVAVPLERLARMLDRQPILSYWSYCLNNWKRRRPDLPIAYDNLQLLQHFADREGDEDGFIKIHTDIEGNGGAQVVAGLMESTRAVREGKASAEIRGGLECAAQGLERMNFTMARMLEESRPERYVHVVRPFIFGFDRIVYEGVEKFEGEPQTLRGETGAQSSIVPALSEGLRIRYRQSILTDHLDDMRGYMPRRHREFLSRLRAGPSIREAAQRGTMSLRRSYNACVHGLLAFNRTHYSYAMQYIRAKTPDNPQGTGGTPYERWLWQLQEDRKQHIL